MDYAVIGGDARFAYLTRLLCGDDRDARAINGMADGVPAVPWADESELPEAKTVVTNWPVPGGEEMLKRLLPGTRVFFCGPGEPEDIPEGLLWTDLWKDERLQVENAWLTAEGAVARISLPGVVRAWSTATSSGAAPLPMNNSSGFTPAS